ncbi:ClC family H(+)/Cl(-) exchange transporter [Clostridium gasigenes]|uniref:ClC family H(+)/Cl(-) exchange transporter n=1 Tax=Clostridium gasigenes TaxID=94869 RepID=UPI001A93A312|nr:ClC family H(+)/Cl(-) exchange transporter [Clostridium gasigenes]QSW20889.1 ClC family H(+)/Cl(-) exchange transporter [Clostridium gasigenes]
MEDSVEKKGIHKLLSDRGNLRVSLIIQGTIIGFITGIVIVLNRIAISKFSHVFKEIYLYSKGSPIKVIGVFLLLALMGWITGVMVKKEPMISGSGIPQVNAILLGKLNVNWVKVLVLKFIGGTMALVAGLSVGREGPSVQMGAAIAQGVSNSSEKAPMKKGFLVTSGAAAGLAAAFNSPLSGMIFVLEEVHRSFSPLVLLPAMAATLMADFVTKQFLGMDPALKFMDVSVIPLEYYWTLVILGVLTGAIAIFFTKGVVISQNIYGRLKKVPIEVKIMIPFLITGVVGFLAPQLLGGGHEIIISLYGSDISILMLIALFLIKFILVLICFGSGVPGGIFLPMLLLGSILGDIFGIIICNLANIPSTFIINFIILAMAGYFAAVVKAPVTAIVLITEMTGSFEHLLAISIVVFIAYITSDLLRSEPVYEVLLDRLLKNVGTPLKSGSMKNTLLEVGIEMGSIVEGKRIKNIDWPAECLLVAIKRGGKEIIPKGEIRILSGDYLVVLVNDSISSEILEALKGLTLVD